MKGIFLLLLSLLFQLYSWAQEGCIHSFTEGDVVCSGQEFSFSAVPNDGANGVISEWTLNGTVVSNSATDYGSYVNNGSTDVVLEYIMVGTTLNGCVDTDTVLITVLTIPTIDLSKKDILCPNQSWMTGTIYLNGVDTIFSLLYTNDVSTTYSNSNSNDSITGLAPDNYYVYYVDTNSCESEIGEVTIIEPAPISYSVYTTIDDNCDQNTGRIQFFGLNGGTAPYSFVDTASGVNYNSGAQNSAVVELSGGNYFVDIIDANGCIKRLFSTPVEITTSNETPPMQPEVENAYSLCKGDSLMIVDTEITNEEMWHYYLFPANSGVSGAVSLNHKIELDPIQANQDSIFIFAIQNDTSALNYGCHSSPTLVDLVQTDCSSDSLVEDAIVNAFSPNDDNVENNTFQIDLNYINDITIDDVRVKIYNRWGDVVKEFENYNNTSSVWHGDNHGGDALPEGTYFYTIEVPSQSFSTSGWVYLDL